MQPSGGGPHRDSRASERTHRRGPTDIADSPIADRPLLWARMSRGEGLVRLCQRSPIAQAAVSGWTPFLFDPLASCSARFRCSTLRWIRATTTALIGGALTAPRVEKGDAARITVPARLS